MWFHGHASQANKQQNHASSLNYHQSLPRLFHRNKIEQKNVKTQTTCLNFLLPAHVSSRALPLLLPWIQAPEKTVLPTAGTVYPYLLRNNSEGHYCGTTVRDNQRQAFEKPYWRIKKRKKKLDFDLFDHPAGQYPVDARRMIFFTSGVGCHFCVVLVLFQNDHSGKIPTKQSERNTFLLILRRRAKYILQKKERTPIFIYIYCIP